MTSTIREERLKVPTINGGQLFMRHLEHPKAHAAVLMLHGLGTSGETFFKEDHGLANYLSEMGVACFVPDLIGHGESWPHLSRNLTHSVHDIIAQDLLRVIDEVERHLKGRPLFLLGQGFGSVLLLSAYARHAKIRQLTQGFVHFNARRSSMISGISHSSLSRLFWRKVMPLFAAMRGDVPLHWTAEFDQPEVSNLYQTYLAWTEGDWIDPVDGFDYGAQLRSLNVAPSLYFAARSNGYLANTGDLREFMREIGTHNGRLLILAKGDGNLRNYNVLSMLQHDDAWVDHFPVVLDWLNERILLQDLA